tara:strand:- start:1847 stop:2458 length:612 start_codon:yes stop_codon:yes gene_type:complete
MSTNDIKHLAAETIYLVPDASEGQLCYLWCDDPAPGLDMEPSEAVEYLRKDVHDAIIAKQANAAKQGMDAAKKVASSNLEQAKRLHAESNPAALESEREANARLTAELEKVQAERDALAALFVRLQDGATDLINASSEEEAGDAMELIAECSEKEARNILARRDLIKQAEVLEEALRYVRCDEDVALLRINAANIRQQAEGHQ